MTTKHFERRTKEDKPVLAICYDFDKTLSPDNMQAQGYIQSVGYDIEDFWKETNELSENNEMDQNLAYMYKMVEEAQGNIIVKKETLEEYGSQVQLFPGVEEWFDRINTYGQDQGVIVEHYIISSGLKEMIEGTSIAKAGVFEKIYASSFYYNDRGLAKWPAQAVNYTNKTQFLFRIEKGVLDVNDPAVNDPYPADKIRVPFRNMVYIGDSDTDIPCMQLVNLHGGHSIGVYDSETMDKSKVYKMMRDKRIKYFVAADYSSETEIDRLMKSIIDRTASNEALETIHYKHKKENTKADKAYDDQEQEKANLIISLDESESFASSLTLIEKLSKYQKWTDQEIQKLMDIAIKNSQVYYILDNPPLRSFYKNLYSSIKIPSKNADKVWEVINK